MRKTCDQSIKHRLCSTSLSHLRSYSSHASTGDAIRDKSFNSLLNNRCRNSLTGDFERIANILTRETSSHQSVALELSQMLVTMKSCALLLGVVLISHSFYTVGSAKVLFPVSPTSLNKACKTSDGSEGTKLFERACPHGSEEMLGYIPHRGNVVCCPTLGPAAAIHGTSKPQETTDNPDPYIAPKAEAGLKARNYCTDHISSSRSLLIDKVIGGRDSSVGEFPHMESSSR